MVTGEINTSSYFDTTVADMILCSRKLNLYFSVKNL